MIKKTDSQIEQKELETSAVFLAYEKLGSEERAQIDRIADRLVIDVKSVSPATKLSRAGMIEALGKIGMFMVKKGL